MVQSMLRKIPCVRDVQVELVLQLSCLGAAKIKHLLRVNGVELSRRKEVLQEFDDAHTDALERLVPGLTDLSSEQAQLPVHLTEVGLTSTMTIATASALASLITSWPKVKHLSELAEQAGLL